MNCTAQQDGLKILQRTGRALALTATIAISVFGCERRPTPSNQKQNVTSPNGKFILSVPIGKHPTYANMTAWKLTIRDPDGNLLYQDTKSDMMGHFNVYWGWDAKDRAWLYNSDDARIWRWEESPSGWTKTESKRSDGIPDDVLPDYARKKL